MFQRFLLIVFLLLSWVPPAQTQNSISHTIEFTAEEQDFIESHPVIRVSNESNSPPLDFAIGKQPQGYNIDLLRLIAKRIGIHLEFINGQSRDTLWKMFEDKELDLIHPVYINDYDKQFGLLSESFFTGRHLYITGKDTPTINNIGDLAGKIVATPKSWPQTIYLQDEHPDISLVLTSGLGESLAMVRNGSAYATIGTDVIIKYYFMKHMVTDLKWNSYFQEFDQDCDNSIHYLVRKDWPILHQLIIKAQQSLTVADLEPLQRKWFGSHTIGANKIELTAEEHAYIMANPVIRVSNEKDYAPYDFNLEGNAMGFSIDLLNLLADQIGLTVTYVHGYSWVELVELFREKKLHLLHTLNDTPERRQMGRLSTPYWHYKNYYIVHQNSPEVHYPHQLYGKTLAVGKGWSQEQFYAKHHPQIKLHPMDDVGSMIEAVSTGKVNAMVLDLNIINYLTVQKGIKDLKVSGWAKDYDNGESRKLHFLAQSSDPELLSILNKTLATLTPENLLLLQKKWFTSSKTASSPAVTLNLQEQDFIHDHPQVVLGGGISFAPFIMQNKFGETSGYDKDIAELISARTGLDINFELGTWKDIQLQAKSYELDGLTASGKDASREKYLNSSIPYLTLTSFIIVKKGNPANIVNLNDLSGKRIALQEGNTIFQDVIAPYLNDNEVIYYDTLTDVLRAVVSEEADVTVFDETVYYLASNYGIGQFIESVAPVGKPFDLVMYLRKDYPELVSIINKGLSSITEEEKNALRQKWLLARPWSAEGSIQIMLSPEEQNYLNNKSTISVTSFPLNMPYLGIDNSGGLDGMAKDYSVLFEDRIPTKFMFHPAKTSEDAVQMLNNGEVDAILFGERSEKLARDLKFTTDYLQLSLGIATTDEKLFIEDITNELDKTFAVIRRSSIEEKLRNQYPTISLVLVDSVLEGLNQLRHNKVYAFIDTPAAIGHTIQTHFLMDVKIAGKVPIDISYGITTRQDSQFLSSIFQKAVGSLNGEDKRRIYNKWVAAKYVEGVNYDLVWKILLAASLFSAVILIWNLHILRTKKQKQAALNELSITQKELEKANKILKRVAATDQLTGLFNRLKLDESLKTEVARKKRYRCNLSVILLDVDKFKEINDTYGHPAGDDVLRSLATLLKGNLREIDIIGRWGGEEFLVICPETDLKQASNIAEKLREKISSYNFIHGKVVTGSFGTAELLDGEQEANLIKRADLALYHAKKGGRNRVEQG
jgi:polar amino acid transport system substrate-binding protein